MREHSRRTFLASVGAASALALAGCSSGSGESDDGGGDTTTTASDDSGSSGDSGSFTETSTVEMNDELAFAPKQIQVSAGTTVTWENVGAVAHSVTAYEDEIPDGAAYFASGGFDSESAATDAYPDEGNIEEGGTYEHTFETTGTYEYYCIPHEMNGMVGTIKVV
ncbi:plastocyanin/azurin family copper-binding protein [Halobacterium wangiae]|uniref:plastocyanin/azurin family copper-binding protein n=1 Tax=Halobacterium wangiae TaxID=2902623 RepID=UPI001E56A989|nr:plastocyanin/azurin family copper-binding protein [Halobacterium wangiae]